MFIAFMGFNGLIGFIGLVRFIGFIGFIGCWTMLCIIFLVSPDSDECPEGEYSAGFNTRQCLGPSLDPCWASFPKELMQFHSIY